MVCTYCLVDMVCEYGHSLVCGLTALMAILEGGHFGQEMFEIWYFEELYTRPVIVEDLSDVSW